MSDHTKGPWAIKKFGGLLTIHGADGEIVVSMLDSEVMRTFRPELFEANLALILDAPRLKILVDRAVQIITAMIDKPEVRIFGDQLPLAIRVWIADYHQGRPQSAATEPEGGVAK